MHPLMFIALSIVIAAFIGGSTNYLAIRMLFRPKRPVYLWGRKLLFTPGLIPKRKEEIARSLGKVVSEYLVTSKGLKDTLLREPFAQSVAERLKDGIRKLARREDALEQLCLEWWSAEEWETLKARLAELLDGWTERGIRYVWEERGLSKLKLEQLLEMLPDWSDGKRAQWADRAADYVVEAVRAELYTERGEQLIRTLVAGALERTGGLMGALAGMFVDEDKLAVKVRAAIGESLQSPQIRAGLQQFVDGQLRRWGEMRLEEAAIAVVGGERDMAGMVASVWSWRPHIDKLLQTRMDELLGGRLYAIEQRLPGTVKFILEALAAQMDNIVAAIELNKLAESQIRDFPVERLEEIILNVSGREFRAITWLGAFLGGVIGLFQALFLQWLTTA